jgi:hypothetical protein
MLNANERRLAEHPATKVRELWRESRGQWMCSLAQGVSSRSPSFRGIFAYFIGLWTGSLKVSPMVPSACLRTVACLACIV